MNNSPPTWFAVILAFGSAVGYMAANLCLRSVTELDPMWVSQMKSLPTVVGITPFVLLRLSRTQPVLPATRIVLLIGVAAFFGQLAGNVSFQWALGTVGIALTVPLTLGTLIVSGAFLGHFVLGDRVTRRMAAASAMLILAITVLSLGAGMAHRSVETTPGLIGSTSSIQLWQVIAGVGAACLAGIAYCGLSLSLRHATNEGAPITSLLLLVGIVGFVTLGTLVTLRAGVQPWVETTEHQYALLLGAGVFNLLAFASLTKALQISSVAFVNALNASQTAMAAIAGVCLFGESLTWPMMTGVTLTVAGLLMMRGRSPKSTRSDHGEMAVLPVPSSSGFDTLEQSASQETSRHN